MTSGAASRARTPVTLTSKLSIVQAEEYAAWLKALADPVRLQIISVLNGLDDDGVSVVGLLNLLRQVGVTISQPTLSHHLRILRAAQLVESSEEGVFHYYKLLPDSLLRVAKILPLERD